MTVNDSKPITLVPIKNGSTIRSNIKKIINTAIGTPNPNTTASIFRAFEETKNEGDKLNKRKAIYISITKLLDT